MNKYRILAIIGLTVILIGGFMWIIDHTIKKIEGFDDDILVGAFAIIVAIGGIIWLLKTGKKKRKR